MTIDTDIDAATVPAAGGPPYVVLYRKGGRAFGTWLWADSWADAEAHLAALRATGTVSGSDAIEIAAGGAVRAGVAWGWAHLVAFAGNAASRLRALAARLIARR